MPAPIFDFAETCPACDTVPDRAFTHQLQKVVIPDRFTAIGDSAFSGCSGLVELLLPNALTSIGDSAFTACSGLVELHMRTL
jgi:hypothetical protein